MAVRNRSQLEARGHRQGRKIALDIIDRTLASLDARRRTLRKVSVEGHRLETAGETFDLRTIPAIYVLGAGKGVVPIAEALEEILEDRITAGLIVEKRTTDMRRLLKRIGTLRRIEVLMGGHPVPDAVCIEGAARMLTIADSAGVNDLVFFCVQGGCTSLTTLPERDISLSELQRTNVVLLESGADIIAVNTVRSALTRLSRGRLAEAIHPARIINLVVNDFIQPGPRPLGPNQPAGWGPAAPVPDGALAESARIMEAFRRSPSFDRLPAAVKKRLKRFDPAAAARTVSDFRKRGIHHHTVVLADPEAGADAAAQAAGAIGIPATVLTSSMEGEAKVLGEQIALVARKIASSRRLPRPPSVAIAVGESTVTIVGRPGIGGRNQELALAAAMQIQGCRSIVIASVGTDGTDGPTTAAGAVVDGFTLKRARKRGMDATDSLRGHDSGTFFHRLQDAVFFDEPGANVCDLVVAVVTDGEAPADCQPRKP